MATIERPVTITETIPAAPARREVPPLVAGDRLTRAEFERRYEAMPEVKKAELIEGVVYMPSPVSKQHSRPHLRLATWIGTYEGHTSGVEGGDNGTVRLDLDNEPQPDVFLRILPAHGGQSSDDGEYVGGAPELVAEVSASSASYDLHDKLNAYRRNGVREYIVWRVWDSAIDWFVLREGRYVPLPLAASGAYQSEVFPGLRLDPAALIKGDMTRVLAALQEGLASSQHKDFVERLQVAAAPPSPSGRGPG